MKSPFKFLDSYTKDDRDIFFGRDREIEELYQRVFDSKLLLIYGVSGTGKSSLIHCGLANKLGDTDWLPIVIRRGRNIIDSMAAGISSAAITEQKNKFASPAEFKKGVRSLYLDHYKPVFFIFDQFEEIFIFGDKEERLEFIRIVKILTESDLQCRMIFVMREEYMAGVTEFERLIPTFFSNRVRIEKMSHRNALDTIKEPCKVFNINLEEGFAESLLEKLSPEGADVELTFLQVFLDNVYRLAEENLPPPGGAGRYDKPKGELSFTHELLQKTGNVSDLLGSFLEEQISLLENPDEGLSVLKSFVSVKGSRRQMSQEEVTEYTRALGQPIKESTLKDLLQTFVNLRILCEKDQNGKYELRHDALAAKIYEKISGVEKEIIEIRQFIENSWNSYQKRKVLISAADLDYIAPYESRLFLSGELEELIVKSKNELVRAKKRRRNIFTAAAILTILVLSAFTFWAVKERNNAVRKEIQARASNYNFLAKELINEDPTIAFRLVEYAYKLDSTNKDIRNNYYQTYYSNNFYKKVELLQLKNMTCQSFLPDGVNLITSFSDGSVKIHDRKGNLIRLFEENSGSVDCFRTSPDGQYIVTVSYEDGSKLWNKDGKLIKNLDWEGNDEIIGVAPDGKSILENGGNGVVNIRDINGKFLKTYKIHEERVFIGTYSPDGKYIVTGSDDKNAILWDLNGNIIQKFIGHQECINSIDFSDDGNLILTGSDDKTARVWDLKGNILSILKAGEEIYSAVFYPDINSVWTISYFRTIYKWNISLNPKVVFNDPARINSVEFSPDSKYLLVGCEGNRAKLWDINGKQIQTYNSGICLYTCASFSPDGKYIITNYHSDASTYTAKFWDISGKEIQAVSSKSSADEPFFIDFSDDGKYFLQGFYSKQYMSIYERNGNLVNKIKNNGGVIYSGRISPDSKSVLTGSFDGTAKLWNLDGSLITVLKHDNYVVSVAFSPDGKHILTGSADKTARLWNLNGELIRVFYSEDEVYSVAFSPDGRNILTGHASGLVRLWNLEGSLLQIFDPKTVEVWAVAFSPNGKYIVSGSTTGLKLFDSKIPVEEFFKRDSIEKLTVAERLNYEITSFKEILNSGNEENISAGADYFLQEAKLTTEQELKNKAIRSSFILYEKALSLRQTNKTLIGLYSARSYDIEQNLKHGADTSNLNDVFQKLLSSNNESELIETADFFQSMTSVFDSDTVLIKHYSKAILFYEKALSIAHSEDVKTELFKCYRRLSQAYLNNGDYLKAITSAKRGIKIKDDINLYSTLTIAYIMNNQYNEAEDIIVESRKNPANYASLRSRILIKINTLEDAGITQPDFEKVKELLKK